MVLSFCFFSFSPAPRDCGQCSWYVQSEHPVCSKAWEHAVLLGHQHDGGTGLRRVKGSWWGYWMGLAQSLGAALEALGTDRTPGSQRSRGQNWHEGQRALHQSPISPPACLLSAFPWTSETAIKVHGQSWCLRASNPILLPSPPPQPLQAFIQNSVPNRNTFHVLISFPGPALC